ncbi:hypothetical protein [Kitasatospora sp. NPDC093102]|uniref:hypothetical protein n=1 Tax=Kitasatospora sp. NPDC093102 TaxID=3155069 RepID=UPI00342DF0B5
MVKDLHVTLPVSGGQLAALPEVAEAARRAETLYGVTLLNDDVARNVVIKHLRKRDQQDWHDEAAGILIIGGIVAAAVIGFSMKSPVEPKKVVGIVAAILAIPAGIAIWARGQGHDHSKQTASVHFTAYIGLLNQARRAGLAFQIPAEWGSAAAAWDSEAAPQAQPQPPAAPAPYPTAPTQPGSWWPADAVIDPKFPVLPTAALARHWALAGRARELGAPYGLDFLDEQVVRKLLTTLRRCRQWLVAWRTVSVVALVTAAILVSLGQDPSGAERAQQFGSAAIGLVAVGVIAALPTLKAYWTWRRSGMHSWAAAYLDLLIEARAYGVPVPVPPSWLDVRNRIRKPS